MSGFVAALSQHPIPNIDRHLDEMSSIIAFRGEHMSTVHCSDRCAAVTMAHENAGYRVHTYNSERYLVIVDGLIFNIDELRPDGTDGSESDVAAIVLAGYLDNGDSWFANLDGSFAVLIADRESGNVCLVRDRFAHRPLYFAAGNGTVHVASEIKAILAAPGVSATLNDDNLYSAIGYGFTPGPETLFAGVTKCIPGFVMKIDGDGRQSAVDYLTPTLNIRTGISLDEATEFIEATLAESVRHYLDVCPDIAILLSGGIDSALISRITADVPGNRAIATSFGAEAWDSDESGFADKMAADLGLEFRRTIVSLDDDLLSSLRRVVYMLEDPTRFENALALETTASNVAGDCAALMTGEGADFILGEREHMVSERLTRILALPGFVRAIAKALPLGRLPSARMRGLAQYFNWNSIRDYGQKGSANCVDLVPGHHGEPPANGIVEMLAGVTSDWPVGAQYTFMTLREAAHCWIERMERIAAAAGLECFHAFESNAMLQFGLEIPSHIRFDGAITKPAVRALAANHFGHEVAYRDKKQLAAPMQLWLDHSTQLRDAVFSLRDRNSRIRQYLDDSAVDRYLDLFERDGAREETTAVHVFRMLTFEIWLELFTA